MHIKHRDGSVANIIIIGVSALVAVGLIVFAVIQGPSEVTPTTSDGRSGLEERGEAVLGDSNAPGRIVEFIDFQCSACVTYFDSLNEEIKSRFIDTGRAYKVSKVLTFIDSYDNNALPRESYNSAKATYCAAEQDAFWPMHDAIFEAEATQLAEGKNENNGNLIEGFFVSVAQREGLDISSFESCYASSDADEIIAQHMADAEAAMEGRVSTPSVFVNGVKVNAFDLDAYESALESDLQ